VASAFTHIVVGAALSAMGRPPRVRLLLALAGLSVLPDLDVVAFGLGIPYEHTLGHRGFSHSLLFAALCGFATPWLSGRSDTGSGEWWRLTALGFAATLSHGVLDALTNGGLGVGFFIPVSAERFFLPWRPLLVSPLSPGSFFSASGARILANEMIWVWFPLAIVFGACRLALRRARHSP